MGIYKKGNVYWMIKQYNGRKVEISLETKSKRKAEEAYNRNAASIMDGSYFEEPVVIPLMKDVIERYMKEVSPMQRSHKRNQEIAAHWLDYVGDLLISEITPSLLSSYKAKRLTGELRYGKSKDKSKQRKAGESTVKKELSFLRQIFTKAIDEWEICSINPVRKVIKGLKENKRVRYVLPEEAELLRFGLPAWLKPLVIVGCQTGLREANIVNLTTSQCDFHNGSINIVDQQMKNGESFSIGMTSDVKKVLQDAIRSRKIISPYVFTDEHGKPFSRHKVSMTFKRTCDRVGIKDLHFHDLRHDFATTLLNNGASFSQVQHAMGHKDPRQTAGYAHLLPENRNTVKFAEGKGTTTILLQSA